MVEALASTLADTLEEAEAETDILADTQERVWDRDAWLYDWRFVTKALVDRLADTQS